MNFKGLNNVTEITIRKSWANVKLSTDNVSSDENPKRICKLIEEYVKFSEIDVCPFELFINIENQTQAEYTGENVEEIIEYLKQVKMRMI